MTVGFKLKQVPENIWMCVQGCVWVVVAGRGRGPPGGVGGQQNCQREWCNSVVSTELPSAHGC
jgi:hypothetical protein